MNLLDQIWAYLERVADRDHARSLDLIAAMENHVAALLPADPLLPPLREAIENLHEIVENGQGARDKRAA